MNIADSVFIFSIMVALALVPSASVALVVTRSATLGISNGVAVSLGIVLADLVFVLLAILGLSIIAETMGWLFLTIKYIGGAYLIWLGFILATTKNRTIITLGSAKEKGSLVASFVAGFFLTLGDIKAVFFYVSLFPTFVNLETLKIADIFIIIVVTIIAVGGIKVFYAFSASKLVTVSKKFQFENGVKKLIGSFMVGVGSYLIMKA